MKKIIAIALSVVVVTGCASIVNGTTQSIGISSNPSQAKVTVNGRELGKTPVIAKLERSENHVLRMELQGYKPFEATLTRSVSGWVWGNILFGGLIGLAVDAISGGLYKLSPEQISGALAADGTSVALSKDGIYMIVTMAPQSDWVQVGQLSPDFTHQLAQR
jgi:hypothetical protein